MNMETEVKLYYFYKKAYNNGYIDDATWLEYCETLLKRLWKTKKCLTD